MIRNGTDTSPTSPLIHSSDKYPIEKMHAIDMPIKYPLLTPSNFKAYHNILVFSFYLCFSISLITERPPYKEDQYHFYQHVIYQNHHEKDSSCITHPQVRRFNINEEKNQTLTFHLSSLFHHLTFGGHKKRQRFAVHSNIRCFIHAVVFLLHHIRCHCS